MTELQRHHSTHSEEFFRKRREKLEQEERSRTIGFIRRRTERLKSRLHASKATDAATSQPVIEEKGIEVVDTSVTAPATHAHITCVADIDTESQTLTAQCREIDKTSSGETVAVSEEQLAIDMNGLSLADELIIASAEENADTSAETQNLIDEYASLSIEPSGGRHHYHPHGSYYHSSKDSGHCKASRHDGHLCGSNPNLYRDLEYKHSKYCTCHKCYAMTHSHRTARPSGARTTTAATSAQLGSSMAGVSISTPYIYSGDRKHKTTTTSSPHSKPSPSPSIPQPVNVIPPTPAQHTLPPVFEVERLSNRLHAQIDRYRLDLLPKVEDATLREKFRKDLEKLEKNLNLAWSEVARQDNLPQTREAAATEIVDSYQAQLAKLQREILDVIADQP